MKKTNAATAAHISNIENVFELNSTTDESMLLNIFSQFHTIFQILNLQKRKRFHAQNYRSEQQKSTWWHKIIFWFNSIQSAIVEARCWAPSIVLKIFVWSDIRVDRLSLLYVEFDRKWVRRIEMFTISDININGRQRKKKYNKLSRTFKKKMLSRDCKWNEPIVLKLWLVVYNLFFRYFCLKKLFCLSL